MSEERLRILNMLSEGKLTVDEAERLLAALGEPARPPAGAPRPAASASDTSAGPAAAPSFLRIVVEPKEGAEDRERVNIRVPLKLLRAGVKLKGLLPEQAQSQMKLAFDKHGLDLGRVGSDNIDEIVAALAETSLDVDADDKTVRIYCE